MGESLDRFLEELCARTQFLAFIFIIASILILLQVPYLFVVEPGETLFVLAAMNVGGFAVFATASGVTLRYCARRQARDGA